MKKPQQKSSSRTYTSRQGLVQLFTIPTITLR